MEFEVRERVTLLHRWKYLEFEWALVDYTELGFGGKYVRNQAVVWRLKKDDLGNESLFKETDELRSAALAHELAKVLKANGAGVARLLENDPHDDLFTYVHRIGLAKHFQIGETEPPEPPEDRSLDIDLVKVGS